MSSIVTLHGFFRSSASYRVRITLNLKGIDYTQQTYRLRPGEQRNPDYLTLNPQGLVPALTIGDQVLTQSLAICEYLDESHPEPPLLPSDPLDRAKVRAAAQLIACDIHPVQNLRILKKLEALGLDDEAVSTWAREFTEEGLDAFEKLLPPADSPFCFGDQPSLADICLVPQLYNAVRFGVDLRWPRIEAVAKNCSKLEAFSKAEPQSQPDAV